MASRLLLVIAALSLTSAAIAVILLGRDGGEPAPGTRGAAAVPTANLPAGLPEIIDVSNLATARPAASPTEPAPATATFEYEVIAGDTAADSAARFDITLDELAAANDTTVEALASLQIGDVLLIPAH